MNVRHLIQRAGKENPDKLVPSMLYQLMEAPEKTRYDLTSLHSIIYVGSPIAVPRLIEAVKEGGRESNHAGYFWEYCSGDRGVGLDRISHS